MSKYDSAGLAMIPSGYKALKVYSLIPNSSDGDFDFARGSSATRVNKDGLIETVATNVPRLDYPFIDGVVQDTPSLLLEPSRSNIINYSEELDNAWWIRTGSTITADSQISPDGSQNADSMVASVVASRSRIYKSSIMTIGTTYTISIFAKYNDLQYLYISDAGVSSYRVIFDIQNADIVYNGSNVDSSNIENYGNGWYRCSLTFQAAYGTPYFSISPNMTNTTWTSSGESMYLWGAMVEAGSYATSYIPTSGSAVTRSAETCNGAGTSADFNSSEGVLFIEASNIANDGTFKFVSLSDNSLNNVVWIYYRSDTNQINFRVLSNASTSFDQIYTINDSTTNAKLALKYKENDFSAWVNGFEVFVDTIGSTFSSGTLTNLEFNRPDDTNFFYGKTKQLITFKQALTDTELEDLTSWDSFSEMATQQLYTIE